MRFARRDSAEFQYFGAIETDGAEADIITVYGDKPDFTFSGNLQPVGKRENHGEYGVAPRYDYAVFTAPDGRFREMDRIERGRRVYEIGLITRWPSHYTLFVKDVTAY